MGVNQNQFFSSPHSVGIEVLYQGTFRVDSEAGSCAVSFLSGGFLFHFHPVQTAKPRDAWMYVVLGVSHVPQLLFSRLHRLTFFGIFLELRSVI